MNQVCPKQRQMLVILCSIFGRLGAHKLLITKFAINRSLVNLDKKAMGRCIQRLTILIKLKNLWFMKGAWREFFDCKQV